MNIFPADECEVVERLFITSDGGKPARGFLTNWEPEVGHNEKDAKAETNLHSEQAEEHQSCRNELKAQWNPPHILRVAEMQRCPH